MSQSKIPTSKWVALVVAVFCMFATAFITPPEGLSQSGLQVLGILVGASILFLTWGTGWPSMATVFAFLTVPDLNANMVTQATFGNSTLIFLMFTFMLAGCLTKSGVARRIAVWFITNKLSRKSPWWTVAMILIAMYVISMPLSSAATFMIMFPIVQEILNSVGINKEQKAPISTALVLGLLVTGLLSNGGNPIAHAMTGQGISFYQSYTGEAMDFFTYCAVATPVTILASVAYFLLLRFVWRPDVSALANVDHEAMIAQLGPMSKKEKWSAFFYVLCIVFWLLPGIAPYVFPANIAAVLGRINNCLPPLLALFLMNFILADGEPVFTWGEAVGCINMGMIMFIAAVMGLGAFMANPTLTITSWLSSVFTPIFSGVSPTLFMVIMCSFMALLCIVCTSAVPLSVTFAIAMPLSLGLYAGQVNPAVIATLVTLLANTSWCMAPCSPISAISYNSGWVEPKYMVKWGALTVICTIILTVTLGAWIGNGL